MKAIVKPADRLQGEINALSSKNYTTRYLLIGALGIVLNIILINHLRKIMAEDKIVQKKQQTYLHEINS